MPLTKLDPMPALVLIDMQKGIVGLPLVHARDVVVANNARLAQAFRARGLPVVLVNVTGAAPGRTESGHAFAFPPDWTDLVPELQAHPDDHRVSKARWGAFHGTSLYDHLRARGVTQVILAGLATSMGVESTARAAYDHGYHVVLVTDAMSDMDAAAHRHSIEHVFPRLGETTRTADVLAQVAPETA